MPNMEKVIPNYNPNLLKGHEPTVEKVCSCHRKPACLFD